MTLEQAALSALASVTGALCVLAKIIWDRSVACENWRTAKEPIISAMAEKLGIAKGALNMVDNCPLQGCPYAGKIEAKTFSLNKREIETKENKL